MKRALWWAAFLAMSAVFLGVIVALMTFAQGPVP